jgi:ribosomal protein S5
MAMATRVVGEEEGKVGNGDGDGNEKTATRRHQDDDETTSRQ